MPLEFCRYPCTGYAAIWRYVYEICGGGGVVLLDISTLECMHTLLRVKNYETMPCNTRENYID